MAIIETSMDEFDGFGWVPGDAVWYQTDGGFLCATIIDLVARVDRDAHRLYGGDQIVYFDNGDSATPLNIECAMAAAERGEFMNPPRPQKTADQRRAEDALNDIGGALRTLESISKDLSELRYTARCNAKGYIEISKWEISNQVTGLQIRMCNAVDRLRTGLEKIKGEDNG